MGDGTVKVVEDARFVTHDAFGGIRLNAGNVIQPLVAGWLLCSRCLMSVPPGCFDKAPCPMGALPDPQDTHDLRQWDNIGYRQQQQ